MLLASRGCVSDQPSLAQGQSCDVPWRRRGVKTTPSAVPRAASESRRGLFRCFWGLCSGGAGAKIAFGIPIRFTG